MKPREPNVLVHSGVGEASRVSVERRLGPDDTLAPTRVGVWDLGAWLGATSGFLSRLSAAQAEFEFLEVHASVPSGMIRNREGVIAWLRTQVQRLPPKRQLVDLPYNTVANDYYEIASVVRRDLRLHLLIGVTPSMVAVRDGDGVFWNLFSTFDGPLGMCSTFELRQFSEETSRPVELYLATLIVALVLAASQSLLTPENPKGFHSEYRGCLFDYSERRENLRFLVADPQIDADCMAQFSPPLRTAAERFIELLHRWPDLRQS